MTTARLGIDVGGTFTDIVVLDSEGKFSVEKVPSTPTDPSVGILNGIKQIVATRGVKIENLVLFAHGSTVATNALLEHKLPRTALVMTKGFGDVLEIANGVRPAVYSMRNVKAEPYVPRDLVFEIAERVDRLGNVLRPLEDEAVRRLVEQVRDADVQAVAITFLFSFRNPSHERQVAAALKAALPGVAVTISSDIAPEIEEYPRANTAVVSAALQPLVADYMDGIVAGMQDIGLDCPLYVMQSNGGVMSASEAAENAHRMVLSGPAAGVLAATKLAEQTGVGNQITFDMGGTSTDIALISDGRAPLTRATEFEGRPLLVPQFAIHTIGAGGGSIAYVDKAGLLHVGPESAGAVPGPACYGRGGTRPATTDAHVVLGRIDPSNFLGGEMSLDVEAAKRAVKEHVADPLGISIEEAAAGILEVADTVMAKGVRVVSVNRGFDPRDFSLLPFGGAGAMHAANVARIVGVGSVLIPSNPGTFSAVGLAQADLKYDFTSVVDKAMHFLPADELAALYEPLEQQAATQLGGEISMIRLARFHYAWQDNNVEIILRDGDVTEESLAEAIERFHAGHLAEFSHNDPEGVVEVASISLEATGRFDFEATERRAVPTEHTAEPTSSREVYFSETGWTRASVFTRDSLRAGALFSGPSIIEEREATIVVPPFATGTIDEAHNIILTIEGAEV